MEANVGDQIRHFYGLGSSSLNPVGKRSLEWDLNDWKWDGHLFVASPLNCKPSGYSSHQLLPETGGSSNNSSTCSDDATIGNDTREQELLRSRRAAGGEVGDAGNLSLMLGGNGVPASEMQLTSWEGANGKKSKVVVGGSSSNRAVCQVEDCGADLSKAKDYHRRHKVCEMHSKASRALVGTVMQRFCQQCSRFHALPEFDEGKRSCRRRLAGHNKRRRKANPLNVAPGTSLNDDQSNNYLLLTLLKILADLHSNRSDGAKNQDMLSHLLRSLEENTVANGGKNITEAVCAMLSNGRQALASSGGQHTLAMQEMPQNGSPSADVSPPPSTVISIKDSPPGYSVAPSTAAGPVKLNTFDLNDVYVDSADGIDDLEGFRVPANNGNSSIGCPSWMQQDVHSSSPPQVSRNSDSGSAQSPSSSSGGDQIRTDRIVFKLFGKEPCDFPLALRTQILDWLAHTPTDIESYIRPGCIVLSIYLRLAESVWDELCLDLSSSLSRLIDVSEDSFWSTGWVYVRVQDQVAFICNGQVVLDTTLPYISSASRILSVRPIAVPMSEKASFSIKGCNIFPPNSRLLCALEGQYLAHENIPESLEESSSNHNDSDKLQVINYSCSIPAIIGRGFVEVEEDNGLGRDFFPFIVAESDICSEICMLESTLEQTETDETSENGEPDARSNAIDFIQEMGWLLRRSQLRLRFGYSNKRAEDLFHFDRFKWLMEFSLDRDWCAVVKKLLDILCDGEVGSGEHDSLVAAVSDMGILHRAVRRNSRPLVELLLRYVPEQTSNNSMMKGGELLFMPNEMGPAGLTPLHIAAGRDGAEAVLDALTDDPNKVTCLSTHCVGTCFRLSMPS
uniref:SBP-type domain-containing protein n=1 Tax=Kalanchoe fedtschenkoi TaxID=63787 RepID=A0A7N0UTR4_KALFE